MQAYLYQKWQRVLLENFLHANLARTNIPFRKGSFYSPQEGLCLEVSLTKAGNDEPDA